MDDQMQQPFSDPSASQTWLRRPQPPAPAFNQSEAAQTKAEPPLPSFDGTRQATPSQPFPHPTHQLATPQPILFSRGEVDVLEEQRKPPRPPQRLRRTRHFLRSRTGRIVVPLLALLVGIAIGLSALIWYGLSGQGPLVIVPTTAQGNLIIEADTDLVMQIVRNDLAHAGLPGTVENVSVSLKRGDLLVVQGDDVYSVLGVHVSRHFTINVQPYVKSCLLQVRVISANLGGIPVTTFVQSFQGNINQELAKKPTGLPGGFAYCTVGVRTEPGGMFITYKAVPLTATP